MQVFEEMKAYVGFGPTDEARLRAAWPRVEARRDDVLQRFYEPILRTPAARAVLKDEAQIERLKQTLSRWLEELFVGPWDEAYYRRRQRIGRVHVDVGLPPRFMFLAMSGFRRSCADVLGHDPEILDSLDRISAIDLAIMTGTYVEGRRAQAETILQQLIVSHLPVTVLLLDRDRRVLAATRADILRDNLVGASILDVLPPALVAASDLDAAITRAIGARRDITLPRVDMAEGKEIRSFRFNIVPLEHEAAAALVHVEDLTQAIEAEARLRRTEALAALGTMSETVAHELRNPLAGISGALQVIARSLPDDDRRRPIMQKVEDQIKRLNVMVTDLLAFARPAPARLQQVDLGAVARASAASMAADHPDATIRVVGQGTATADPDIVQLILVNLVQNAIQASDGPATVELRVAPGRVIVADDGPGVAPEAKGRLFEPFFTTRTRGSGLGLPTSQKVAASMGGQVTLEESGPLRGATFKLELRP